MLQHLLPYGVWSLIQKDDIHPPLWREIRQGHGEVRAKLPPGAGLLRQDRHIEVATRTLGSLGAGAENRESG